MQGRTMRLYRTSLVLLAACITIAGCASSPGDTGGETPTGAAPSPPSEAPGLTLVAIGDSIPYNSEDDCPGCTGYIDRYADAVSAATGQPVEVLNLSQHTGLTLPQLLDTLYSYEEDVAGAEVIVVGIAHNSSELATFRPCGAPKDDEGLPEWSKIDDVVACAEASAEKFRPQFESLYSQIAAWREGEPTILRAINRYNDWIGWREAALGPMRSRRPRSCSIPGARWCARPRRRTGSAAPTSTTPSTVRTVCDRRVACWPATTPIHRIGATS